MLGEGLAACRNYKFDEALRLTSTALQHTDKQKKPRLYRQLKLLEAQIHIKNRKGRKEHAFHLLRQSRPEIEADLELKALWRWLLALHQGIEQPLGKALMEEAAQLATPIAYHALLAEIIAYRNYYLPPKTYTDAETAYLEMLEHAKAADDPYLEASALVNLGLVLLKMHRWDEALDYLDAAPRDRPEARRLKGSILVNMGICSGRLGYYRRARQYLEQAVAFYTAEGDRTNLQNALGELGNIYYFQNQYQEAEQQYKKAFEVEEAAIWAGNRASALVEMKNWGEAEKWNDKAVALKKAKGNTAGLVYQDLTAAFIASGRQDFQEAEKSFKKVLSLSQDHQSLIWEAHSGLGRIYAARGERDQAVKAFEEAVREIKRATDLSDPENRMRYFSRLVPFYLDYVDYLVEQGMENRALEIVEASRAGVLRDKLHTEPQREVSRTYEDYAETARDTGKVFLSYWLAPGRSFLWVFRPTGDSTFHILPPADEIVARVEAFGTFIARGGRSLDNPAGVWLSDKLIPKNLEPHTNVVLVADRQLWGLSFETLPFSKNGVRDYWIKDVTISLAPSLDISVNLSEEPTNPPSGALLMGDPNVSDYSKLTAAEEEIEAFKKYFGDRNPVILTGDEAHPEAYAKAEPGSFKYIGFVAHGEANRYDPLSSAVILSKVPGKAAYKLTARDIMNHSLDAEVVTVSACRSAGSEALPGEGLMGFTWAFLHAGADHVVAGLWDVEDRPTAVLMGCFYKELAKGVPPVKALHEAKLSLIETDSVPYRWGAFQIYARGWGAVRGQ